VNLPPGDGDDAPGESSGPVEFVGGEDDGGAAGDRVPDEAVDDVASGDVEAGVGLVEEPEVRSARGQRGKRGPAPLPSGEAGDDDVAEPPAETEALQDVVRSRRRRTGRTNREADVLGDREVVVEEPGMAEHADAAADRPAVDAEVAAEDDAFAFDEGYETGADAEEGGLAGAVGPADEDDLARGDVEVDAGEGGKAAEEGDGAPEVDYWAHMSGPKLPVPPPVPKTGDEQVDAVAPSPFRTVVRGVGKTLIGAGVLILLFVVYELWGTNLAEARSQRSLKRQFAALLAPTTTRPPSTTVAGSAPTTTPPPAPPDTAPPPAPQGSAVAIIKIPRIGIEKAVVEGVGVPDLKKGPGHYPKTPMPGQTGNAAIAGHRTTYGAPFNRIDELQPNDPVFVTTRQGKFRYEVERKLLVAPSDVSVLRNTIENILTLTTCNPKYSARQRLVVVARLIGIAAEAPPPPPTTTTTTVAPSTGSRPRATAAPRPTQPVSQQPVAGLSGVRSARLPALLWGLACALVAIAAWVGGQVWRKWLSYLIATPIFLLLLFVFFENFARLLPANI